MSFENIVLPEESAGLWVFIELKDGRPVRVSLELLGEGHAQAKKLGVEVSAILIGEGIGSLGEELIYYGADRVIIADDPVAKDYRTEVYTDIIAQKVIKERPEILLFGATCMGRDLAPRVSARLKTGCTADCTGLDIDLEKKILVASKPYFGRSVMADIICPRHRPQVVTIRPGVMELQAPDMNRRGELVYADVNIKEDDISVKIIETVRSAGEGVALEDAEKVVAGGMGLSDEEGFDMLTELAELMGAEVGSTSLPVDAGWVSHDRLIGQTGKTIRPRLYIGCGISGAIQHSAGIINSEIIVAINNNPRSEIFGFADYGVVGDIKEVIPAIIKELK